MLYIKEHVFEEYIFHAEVILKDMKIRLTEKGKKVAESLEIPKDIKGRFESIFINDKYDDNAIHIKCQPKELTLC